jgi:hypothetical protein
MDIVAVSWSVAAPIAGPEAAASGTSGTFGIELARDYQ